jgi:RTX calcium-binding nonapeptide repeat (4 copies)
VSTIPRLRRIRRLLCATGACLLCSCGVALAMANHEGWPVIGHHQGHPNSESGVMRGELDVHNMLLGGGGNDTIWAGDDGDVIWGDSHPGEQPTTQRDYLHGGPGEDWIYASHGYNVIWTGAGNDHVALVYGYGTVYCNGPGLKTLVVRYLPENRHYRLIRCTHTLIYRYRA